MTENYLQIYVELPKLAGVAPESMSAGELFLSAMHGLYEWDERPAEYRDKSLDRLFAESAYGGLSDEEQIKHEKEMTTERDYQEALAFHVAESFEDGKAEGRAEGLKEGLKRGANKARLEMAQKLKASGVSAKIISQCTGLTLGEVNSL